MWPLTALPNQKKLFMCRSLSWQYMMNFVIFKSVRSPHLDFTCFEVRLLNDHLSLVLLELMS